MTIKKARFIANPFSGANRKRDLAKLLREHLDKGQFDYELCWTERAGHAIELAAEAVQQGFDLVVACGGDGSVNEVASQLIGTDTVLGVLPCGSGNGFAMHIGQGRDVAKAIGHLNNGRAITIDTATMNGRPFVNLAGIGFDAAVARRLTRNKVRGMLGYVLGTLREVLGFRMLPVDIEVDGKKIKRTCLLVEVANAPVYGYGFSIVPHARFNDGQLEVLVANAAPKWRYLLESWRFLNRSFHRSPLVECLSGREITVTPARPTAAHMDGEGQKLMGSARFSIQPKSLKVLCPKAHAEILGR